MNHGAIIESQPIRLVYSRNSSRSCNLIGYGGFGPAVVSSDLICAQEMSVLLSTASLSSPTEIAVVVVVGGGGGGGGVGGVGGGVVERCVVVAWQTREDVDVDADGGLDLALPSSSSSSDDEAGSSLLHWPASQRDPMRSSSRKHVVLPHKTGVEGLLYSL